MTIPRRKEGGTLGGKRGPARNIEVSPLEPSQHWNFWKAPRCGARTRRGTACLCPAMRQRKRCRLHGGHSSGPKTEAGIRAIQRANTVHGHYSKAAIQERREARQTLVALRGLIGDSR